MRGKGSSIKGGLLILFFILFRSGFSQNIPPEFFGQNAWMPDTIGKASACPNPPCILYGKLHKHWKNIQNSGAAVIRFGGIAADRNMPTNFQYIKMIDSIRAKGMEPIIQVPFHNWQYTAQQAANIVQYVNIVKGKNIKYWIIGNEPDLGYSYTSSSQVASYFKQFASAMKAVDPTILTIGPETAWFNQTIINGLTNPGGADDITGRDAAGRFYLDIISFHYYPFNGSQTRAQAISKLTVAGGLQDKLIYLNSRLANCNAAHNRTGSSMLKTAITEANINYQNSSTDNLNGVGANSFLGGQFIAEMLAVGMKNKVNFINVWSVIEGNTTALNIGYIDPPTLKKKPSYYHYKLVADNFKGNFLNGTTNLANVKTFGSQNSQYIQVMVMNQELSGSYNFTVRMNTAAVSGSNPLKININAGLGVEYSDVISNQTTILLTFNPQGTLVKKCTYSLANHAANNLPPSCESFVMPITLTSFNAVTINESVQIKWSTANEINNNYFTVERSIDGLNFEILESINGAGNSNVMQQYETVDKNPYKGISYYRLKQTDYNGEFTYSEIRAVNLQETQLQFVIYPNPSSGVELFVDLTGVISEGVKMDLYDISGRQIKFSIKRISNEGKNTFRLYPESELSNGVYVLVINSGEQIQKQKILVQKR